MLGKPLTWLSLAGLAMVVFVALLVARATPSRSAAAPTPSGLAADIVIPPRSMAASAFTLQAQDGKPVSVSGLRGRVLAITFLDSHCKQLCPLEGDQLGQVQRTLGSTV